MKLNDHKIQNGGLTNLNGNLQQDNRNVDHQDAYEGTNGSASTGSVSPIDTIPFNIEGIQTVIKNSEEPSLKARLENGLSSQDLLTAELQRYKEENNQLRAALKEASRVNQQWRSYHDQRQGYEQKLLSSLQDLQQSSSLTQENERSNVELQRLREAFSKQQKEHNEHIQLLQLQVRAHRDDWEAERSEKKAAEFGRIQAEAQLQVIQRQLEEATAMVADLEGRLKLCKCFGGCDGETANNTDKKVIPFHYQNGNLPVIENTPRISPSFSSTNSMCSGTSRSSSVSKDLSACSSPTIAKGLQLLTPHGVNAESSRTSSPSVRLNPPKASGSKPNENYYTQERTLAEIHSCTRLSPQLQQEEVANSLSKVHQNTPDFGSFSKSRGNAKIREVPAENSLHYYESKGARPKTVGKVNDEEERQAKHRARSILASALPMSPSSSKPSSPVTVSPGKGANIPKGYIPITSTILTPVKFRPPFSSEKKSESALLRDVCSKDIPKPIAKSSVNNPSKKNELTSNQFKSSEQPVSTPSDSRGDTSPKCKHSSSRKFSENLVACNASDQTEYRQRSSIHINGLTCHSTGASEYNCNTTKSNSHGLRKAKTTNEDNSTFNDGLDIKTATKMKQNTKSLIVTNNQQDRINTNYASITVMPGPSSALYSHTQTSSTTSSRSSSPGISLTTFALNANGQGVPGAIFFALGTEPKSSKSPQPQPNVSVLSSVTSNQPQEEVHSSKNNPASCKESSECETNDRIVNSAWVQLMDKENNSTRPTSRTPWRTARAVPSHKLNSVRKTHPEDVSSNGLPPLLVEGVKQEESSQPSFISGPGNKTLSNGHNYLKPQNNYETRYQASISPTPNYVSCSRTSPSLSLTSPAYSQANFRSTNSPTICIIPHSNYTQTYAEADLRSMASRNISSAILSYECGSKECAKLQGRKQLSKPPNNRHLYTTSPLQPHTTIEASSEHCLICPSCQKLFPENSPEYAQHLRGCGGPKYADM